MKILSWNILGPKTIDEHWFLDRYPLVTHWHHRFGRIIERIIFNHPDIICLQEVDPGVRLEFLSVLKGHGYMQGSYERKGRHGGVLVLYKKSVFDSVAFNHMQVMTSGDTPQHGACAWVTLYDKKKDKEIIVASVHFQPHGINHQLELFIKALGDIKIPIVMIGDFNTKYVKVHDYLIPYLNTLPGVAIPLVMFEHHSWTHQSTIKHDGIGGWSSVDQCLYSQSLQINKEHSFVGTSHYYYQSDLVSFATNTMVQDDKEAIPNDYFVSDHLPLVVVFDL